jgi:hypothetical protein
MRWKTLMKVYRLVKDRIGSLGVGVLGRKYQ